MREHMLHCIYFCLLKYKFIRGGGGWGGGGVITSDHLGLKSSGPRPQAGQQFFLIT